MNPEYVSPLTTFCPYCHADLGVDCSFWDRDTAEYVKTSPHRSRWVRAQGLEIARLRAKLMELGFQELLETPEKPPVSRHFFSISPSSGPGECNFHDCGSTDPRDGKHHVYRGNTLVPYEDEYPEGG